MKATCNTSSFGQAHHESSHQATATWAGAVTDMIERLGLDVKAICERAGVDHEFVQMEDGPRSRNAVARLWKEAIAASLSDPDLSFALPGGARSSRIRHPECA